jgi:hypothetical protein
MDFQMDKSVLGVIIQKLGTYRIKSENLSLTYLDVFPKISPPLVPARRSAAFRHAGVGGD